MEAGALVTLALGLLAELSEVRGSLGDNVVEELEVDAASLGYSDRDMVSNVGEEFGEQALRDSGIGPSRRQDCKEG